MPVVKTFLDASGEDFFDDDPEEALEKLEKLQTLVESDV